MQSHTTLYLLPITVVLLLISSIIRSYCQLAHIPGPLAAKFTDLWRLWTVKRLDSHDTFLALHKRHGDFVRIGPNSVSISRPDTVQAIYGIQKGFVKSRFYEVWQNVVNGKTVASLVFTTDEQQHVFLARLDELFAAPDKKGKVCDLGCWIGWYAFDVIGELTFSKRLGFMEKAVDVEGIAALILSNFERCAVLGQMPWLDWWTPRKNPFYRRLFGKRAVMSPIIAFGQRRMQERVSGKDDDGALGIDIADPVLREKVLHGVLPSKPDFPSRFLKLHEEQPDVVTDRALLAYLFMNINAGSDTISATVRALFYHSLKQTNTLIKLRKELDDAVRAGELAIPLPTWTECQRLPHLNACIKKALRLNSALALPLERIVPPSGLQIGETFFPPGTVVGINPWVLHRDTRIFGSDAESWIAG